MRLFLKFLSYAALMANEARNEQSDTIVCNIQNIKIRLLTSHKLTCKNQQNTNYNDDDNNNSNYFRIIVATIIIALICMKRETELLSI